LSDDVLRIHDLTLENDRVPIGIVEVRGRERLITVSYAPFETYLEIAAELGGGITQS
jgi:hypothetical protein